MRSLVETQQWSAWKKSMWVVCAEVSAGLMLQILVGVTRVGDSYGSELLSMVSGRYECVASVSEGSGPSDGPSRVMKFQVFGLLDVID
ncbi:hypothetical protein IGI04_024883 [Brassica rapa subsp. trilocularis]|uniref:Uncharacterized protein n=1 Tax=Brassica rapa subsp. trilocularis TaxID=1813537 RepID=A0ABQ7M802_BRACM|nr:hypothetical protein IGI04_024883 [Brassica rapa subsp. trilocularis]